MQSGRHRFWSVLDKSVRAKAWFGIAEIMTFLVAMVVVDYFDVLPVRLLEIAPHPFWIPVILGASFYGRAVGYTMAIAASIFDAALGWPNFTSSVDVYDYLTTNAVNPALWLSAAAVLGRFREKHLDRLRDVEQASEKKAAEALTLAQRCQALGREVNSLEHRIAVTGASAASATLQVLDRALVGPAEDAYHAVSDALHRLIGATGMDLYLPNESGWFILSSDESAVSLAADASTRQLCDSVVSSDRILSCARVPDCEILAGHAALASPIRANDGKLLAVVLIREVDPACLTNAGEAALSVANFILGARYLQPELLAIESGYAEALRLPPKAKPRLRVVNGGALQVRK